MKLYEITFKNFDYSTSHFTLRDGTSYPVNRPLYVDERGLKMLESMKGQIEVKLIND